MKIITKAEIERAVNIPLLIQEIEKGLIQYSEKKAQISPVGFLHFKVPPGDVHIKAGALEDDDYYVIKIASGFYDNSKIGMPTSNGMMLLFKQNTGELEAILHDEGFLTDLRTGVVGAICAKAFGPSCVERIGIIGTGTQARMQLKALADVTSCREVLVWGRNFEKAKSFVAEPQQANYRMRCVKSIQDITENCNLIITTTTSSKPLLFGKDLLPGTHITAVGADGPGKQELDESVFDKADLIVADSLQQCLAYGDLSYAKAVNRVKIYELGALLKKPLVRAKDWITVADLTGVAIADLQAAKYAYSTLFDK